jgi:hypothetical protein
MPLHSAALGGIIGHRERAMRFELDARYLRSSGRAWSRRGVGRTPKAVCNSDTTADRPRDCGGLS